MQATLIVENSPNLTPIPTIKSSFDPTISAAHLHPFNQFLCGTERFSQICNFDRDAKRLESTFPAQSRYAIWA